MVKFMGQNIYAAIPSPDVKEIPINFTIPGINWEIHLSVTFYALCIVTGIIVGFWMTTVRWRKLGVTGDATLDIAIWAVPAGLIGARLYHVFTSPENYFGPQGSLANIPKMWEGGGGIWGAIILGGVGAAIACRLKDLKFWSLADAAAPGLLIAQGIGRWGNYFNQELYGRPTSLPWGLTIDHPAYRFVSETTFHPTFLYESLWCFAGAALLIYLDRRFRFTSGRLFWLYVMYYTFGRFWIENLRVDEANHITIFDIEARLNVWVSVGIFCVSLILFVVLSLKAHRENEAGTSPATAAAPEDGTGRDSFSGNERADYGMESFPDSYSGENADASFPEGSRPYEAPRSFRRRQHRSSAGREEDNSSLADDIGSIAIGNQYGAQKSARPITLESHYNDSSLRGRAKEAISSRPDDIPTPPPAPSRRLEPTAAAGASANPPARYEGRGGPVRTRRERRKKN